MRTLIRHRVVNTEDPDKTPRSVESDLHLYCLYRPVSPSTYGKHGNVILILIVLNR